MTVETMQKVPIAVDAKGQWRVEGTRVGVDVIIGHYLDGATPDQIAEDFPAVSPGQIYGVIAYYLDHREAVETYLSETEEKAREMREQIESTPANEQLRDLLRSRRKARNVGPT